MMNSEKNASVFVANVKPREKSLYDMFLREKSMLPNIARYCFANISMKM
jgi:hypothetical protein